MANNKVQLSNGTVLLDLSNDTVTSSNHILAGQVGHLANGTQVTGTLVIQHYYTGSGEPSASLGENGDIYLQS